MSVKSKRRPRQLLPFLCRICLTKSHAMSDLTEFFDNEKSILILHALEWVMACDVPITQEAPNHLCSMCLSLLRISYDLRIQFEESQQKISENIIESTKQVSISKKDFESKQEVELIYRKQNYSLRDILIIEDDDHSEDYLRYLNNLDESVSIKVKNVDKNEKPSNSWNSNIPEPKTSSVEVKTVNKNNKTLKANGSNSVPEHKDTNTGDSPIRMKGYLEPNNEVLGDSPNEIKKDYEPYNKSEECLDEIDELYREDFEMIVIKTGSDNETDQSFHWEHEYAKSSPETTVQKKGGRKGKYPELMDKINSLIIEGDPTTEQSFKKKDRKGRKTRFTDEELEEIEKYIIYTGPDNQSIQEQEWEKYSQPEDVEQQIKKVIVREISLNKPNSEHICHICRQPFVTKGSMNRHLRRVHRVEVEKREKLPRELIRRRRKDRLQQYFKDNPMLCQLCGHVSKSPGGARYHSLTHTGKKLPCDLCPRTFLTSSHLKHHREYKHGNKERKHLCPWCGEYRNSASSLAYHIKVHKNEAKKIPCHLCGVTFVVKSALNTHLRRHNGDRRFPCQYCPKSFYSSNERNKHSMIHTGEKPHKCKYCDKRFIAGFNKRVHMMTHDGPYECDYCNKGFIDAEVLNIHLKYKHHVKGSGTDVPNLMLSQDEEDLNDAEILEGLELLPSEDANLVFEED